MHQSVFIIVFARFSALVKDNKMLAYEVVYLGCWSIFAHATSEATDTVKSNVTYSTMESGPTKSLDPSNELSYQPKLQFVAVPFFTPRFVRGDDVQLRERVEDMREGFRDLTWRVQKLEGQDRRAETTSNETVVDACRCNGKSNQSGIVEEDSSESTAAKMTTLFGSIESSIREFRTSLDVVQEKMKSVNQNLNEIADVPTMPGIEPNTALRYSYRQIVVPMNTNDTLPSDCWDVFKAGYNVSGVYKIKPASLTATTFFVYCQMDVHGGGWTVFQNRYDGQLNFYQDWKHYKSGFGNLNAEFWLGLDHIHELTKNKRYEILIELKDFDSQTVFATYDKFLVDSEAKNYRILSLGAYKGNAGDAFSYHVGKNFSTWDMDNDHSSSNCAADRIGAWWFGSCSASHLNGPYSEEKLAVTPATRGGIFWYDWKNNVDSLKESRMSIRPRGVAAPKETKKSPKP